MFWVLLGFIGVMLFVITFMKEPRDKQDERQVESYQWVQKNKWKLRIIGIILCWIGVGGLFYKEEAKNIQEDIQKETPKTFGKLEDFEKKLQKMLASLNVYYTIQDAPLLDGRPRKLYDAKFSSIEIIGNPEVEKVSVMFIPNPSDEEVKRITSFILAPFSILCNPNDNEEDSKKFWRTLGDTIENAPRLKGFEVEEKKLETTFCKIKIIPGTKDFPLWVITFEKK
jgi:hypothetical protein